MDVAAAIFVFLIVGVVVWALLSRPYRSHISADSLPTKLAQEASRGFPYYGPEVITSSRGHDADELGADQEYVHEYVRASEVTEKKGLGGLGLPQEVASPYPVQGIEAHLNKRAKEGWSLASMEPHWYWERVYISMAMSITKPLAIVGWYLTFRRK